MADCELTAFAEDTFLQFMAHVDASAYNFVRITSPHGRALRKLKEMPAPMIKKLTTQSIEITHSSLLSGIFTQALMHDADCWNSKKSPTLDEGSLSMHRR
jgi:hypothetical protein